MRQIKKHIKYGLKFDSRLELFFYELCRSEGLKFDFQVPYELHPPFKYQGKTIRAMTLTVDFEFIDYGKNVIVDTKGFQRNDNKLKWKAHLEYIYKKCLGTLFQMKKIVGATWGTSPTVTNMIYNCIVKPALLYGVVAWYKCLKKVTYLKKLQKIQAQACRLILGVQRSTPVAAMEVILNLRPLEIEAESKALLAAGRLRRCQDWRLDLDDNRPTTARIIENKINDKYAFLNLPTTFTNKTICHTFFEYSIDSSVGDKQIEVTPSNPEHIHVYTDGSKDLANQVGYGYTIKTKTRYLTHEAHFNLGSMPSVFQAEVMAVKAAADHLLLCNAQDKTIKFYIDNQAAIYALRNVTLYDSIVLETKRSLNLLAEGNLVKLNWIPGHCGFMGNEAADRKAKLGTQAFTLLCEPAIPVMNDFFSSKTKKLTFELHNETWRASIQKYKKTRLFFHELRPRESKWLLKQGREKVHDLTGIITGHNSLNYHQYIIGNTDSPTCRLCSEGNETAEHLFVYCPAIVSQIQINLGFPPLRRMDLSCISLGNVSKIWAFILGKIMSYESQ